MEASRAASKAQSEGWSRPTLAAKQQLPGKAIRYQSGGTQLPKLASLRLMEAPAAPLHMAGSRWAQREECAPAVNLCKFPRATASAGSERTTRAPLPPDVERGAPSEPLAKRRRGARDFWLAAKGGRPGELAEQRNDATPSGQQGSANAGTGRPNGCVVTSGHPPRAARYNGQGQRISPPDKTKRAQRRDHSLNAPNFIREANRLDRCRTTGCLVYKHMRARREGRLRIA
uniref:Uncharacterized protein n=1 Tax=Trichuris muris TaxID=70415 RepID=A0A5S6QYM5_TRIMR